MQVKVNNPVCKFGCILSFFKGQQKTRKILKEFSFMRNMLVPNFAAGNSGILEPHIVLQNSISHMELDYSASRPHWKKFLIFNVCILRKWQFNFMLNISKQILKQIICQCIYFSLWDKWKSFFKFLYKCLDFLITQLYLSNKWFQRTHWWLNGREFCPLLLSAHNTIPTMWAFSYLLTHIWLFLGKGPT